MKRDADGLACKALNLGATEEGDPILSCVFKTELVTHILTATSGMTQVIISPTYVDLWIYIVAS